MNKRSARPAPPPAPAKKSIRLWVAIGAVIVIALGIAVWSTRGNDTKVSVGTVGTDNSSSSAAETQPVTVVGTALAPPPQSGADAEIGATPPILNGFTFAGAPIEITPGGGRAKMVVFLAHWCPHCNREIPVIEAWAQSGLPANLDIIGVSTGVAADRDNYPPSAWIVKMGWKWPVMADSAKGDAALAYGVSGYPTFLIIGADGKVKVRNSGELPVADLDAMVKKALAS